jgi:glycosyltransferase involved in cell wall biosynthesis
LKNVLIFRKDLLAISETFVFAQAKSLTKYTGRFFGLTPASPTLPIAGDSVFLTRESGILSAIRVRLYRLTGWAPLFHRQAIAMKPDLVHVHFATDGVTALPLVNAVAVPLVVTLHGFDVTISDEFRTSAGARQYMRLRPALWKRAARFLCVSEFIRQKAIEGGFPAEKLEVHYIGIDLRNFRFREREPEAETVLFVGRMVEKKGLRYLVEAMQIVARRHPDARLRVIGTGPLQAQCAALAQELKVAVEFLGPLSSSEVRQELQQAAVFCVPSVTAQTGDSEGLPIVVLEAMAMGVPLVASRHAGISEAVVDDETGILTGEKKPEQIAVGICRFLEDKEFARRCAVAAEKRVRERFDLAVQTRKLEDIYDAVAGSEVPGTTQL